VQGDDKESRISLASNLDVPAQQEPSRVRVRNPAGQLLRVALRYTKDEIITLLDGVGLALHGP
jgi:hypothetical protein